MSMIKCPECNSVVDDSLGVCSVCGYPFEKPEEPDEEELELERQIREAEEAAARAEKEAAEAEERAKKAEKEASERAKEAEKQRKKIEAERRITEAKKKLDEANRKKEAADKQAEAFSEQSQEIRLEENNKDGIILEDNVISLEKLETPKALIEIRNYLNIKENRKKLLEIFGVVVLALVVVTIVVSFVYGNSINKKYMKEARYFYEQMQAILDTSNAVEEYSSVDFDNDAMGMLSNTFEYTTLSAVCLNELIQTSSYSKALENSFYRLEELYIEKDRLAEIKQNVENIYEEYGKLRQILDKPGDYNTFEKKYLDCRENIEEYNEELFEHVKNVESASHDEESLVENNTELQAKNQMDVTDNMYTDPDSATETGFMPDEIKIVNIAKNEVITIENECEFCVKGYQINDIIQPDRPANYYHYFEADSGNTYVDIKMDIKSLHSSEIKQDMILDSVMLVYDENYEYSCSFVTEEDGGSDFNSFTILYSINPLETLSYHMLAQVPKEVKDNSKRLSVIISANGSKYRCILR